MALRSPSKRHFRTLFLAACLTTTFALVFLHQLHKGLPDHDVAGWRPRGNWPLWRHQDPTRIPRKLWYKLGAKGLTEDARKWTKSCIDMNPDYEVIFFDETAADDYVRKNFASTHPDIAKLYLQLPIPILKADIFRLLVVYVEGGIYLDLDVSCLTPFDTWIPSKFLTGPTPPQLVVGWEFDFGYDDYVLREFASWTIVAAKRSPHLWATVQDTYDFLSQTVEKNNLSSAADIQLPMVGDVVDATGPRRLTNSIRRSVKETLLGAAGLVTENSTKTVEAEIKGIERLMEPKMMGDVLVMPGWAWARSMQKWEEFEKAGGIVPPSLAEHHFAGSWKNDNGGETAD